VGKLTLTTKQQQQITIRPDLDNSGAVTTNTRR